MLIVFSAVSCLTNVDACNENEVCVLESGNYTCQCPDGYLVIDGVCTG